MRENIINGGIPFREAYIQAVVDPVEVDDHAIRIFGDKDPRTGCRRAGIHRRRGSQFRGPAGIVAYRNSDLKLALADFNRAIALNRTFMIAYINRGIVLYRMGELDRALADVARARQIDQAGRARSAAALHRKRRRDVSLIDRCFPTLSSDIVAQRKLRLIVCDPASQAVCSR
jgi:tetratricopeptide (TPR) repeat protein